MIVRLELSNQTPSKKRKASGLTLIEVLASLWILGMLAGALIMGYVQIDRMAEWSSMSLAAQSIAQQGYEQVKSANWNYGPASNAANWPNANDQLGFPPVPGYTNYFIINTLDVPSSGAPIFVTNFITITNVSVQPPLRQVRSDCVWTFPFTGTVFTNTVISLFAPDA